MNLIKDKVLSSDEEYVVDEPGDRFIYRLVAAVREELAEAGDREWIVDTETGNAVQLSSIEPTSRRVASYLAKLGFTRGDVLHTGYSTNIDFYWPVLGAWMCGGVVSLGNPSLSKELIKSQLQDTGAKVVVCSLWFAGKYAEIVEELRQEGAAAPLLYVLDVGRGHPLPGRAKSFLVMLEDGGQDAPFQGCFTGYSPLERSVIFWSSGSTGVPKGIVHPDRNLHLVYHLNNKEKIEKLLVTNIQLHIGAFMINLTHGIFKRIVCCFIKELCFTPEHCLDVVEKYRPEYLIVDVNHYIRLSQVTPVGQRFPSLKFISPAGGAVTPGVTEKVLSILGGHVSPYEAYGCTEAWLVCWLNDHTPELGLLGKILPGGKIYIADRVTGQRLGPGKVGKIMLKTPTMMLGFLNREEETQQFFDKDGFGFCGDIGYYDAGGNLYYVDRMKDIMKVDGYWFGPGEIESLLEAEAEVVEAQVWGEYNFDTGNEQVHLGIVFKNSAKPWSEDRIREFVGSRLPVTRRITGNIYILPSLPHNPQGKKLRLEMREYVKKAVQLEE